MKLLLKIGLLLGCHFGLNTAFLTAKGFSETTLKLCYESKIDSIRDLYNGQEFPLPSSIETFISLVERLEDSYNKLRQTQTAENVVRDLLRSFRIDDLVGQPSKLTMFRQASLTDKMAEMQRLFFNINDGNYPFKPEHFTKDEKCALHFMLSHTVNNTIQNPGNDKPSIREHGVVSIGANTEHAFALGRVLLGILAGLTKTGANAMEVYQKMMQQRPDDLTAKVDRLYAVTVSDLFASMAYPRIKTIFEPTREMRDYYLPNGLWDDAVCPTKFQLDYSADNFQPYPTQSLLFGAFDGLVIGNYIQQNPMEMNTLRLSQILRMYYGRGNDHQFSWCNRKTLIESLRQTYEDQFNEYDKLFRVVYGINTVEDVGLDIRRQVISAVNSLLSQNSPGDADCSPKTTTGRNCETPNEIFAVLDMTRNEQVQLEVIGNLSVNFDMRPGGSAMGVYTNLKPQLSSLYLDPVVNISQISGCPACYLLHYQKRTGVENEQEVINDLNRTVLAHIESENQEESNEIRPAKVVLYFNYGQPDKDKVRDTIIEIERYYPEITILAIGNKQESLKVFTRNTDRDYFQDTGNSFILADKLRNRICKVPAEFRYNECSRGPSSGTSYEGFITPGRMQYFAMYPKYFLKSYGIRMKFSFPERTSVRVCFSRYYSQIIRENGQSPDDCKEAASGGEIEFSLSNPCHRRKIYTCNPFYFVVEVKKASQEVILCKEYGCKTAEQVRFEFSHEGISCNSSNFISLSFLNGVIALLTFFIIDYLHKL